MKTFSVNTSCFHQLSLLFWIFWHFLLIKKLMKLTYNRLYHTSALVLSCKFAAYFQNTFSQEYFWAATSENNSLNYLGLAFHMIVAMSSFVVLIRKLHPISLPKWCVVNKKPYRGRYWNKTWSKIRYDMLV